MVCADGQSALAMDPSAAQFPWRPQAVTELGEVGAPLRGLLDQRALLLFGDKRCLGGGGYKPLDEHLLLRYELKKKRSCG